MGLKDKLSQLGKIKIDFWNEGKPQSVTVDLPAPEPELKSEPVRAKPVRKAAPKAEPPLLIDSEAARRLRKILDEGAPKPKELLEAEARADELIARAKLHRDVFAPPITFTPEEPPRSKKAPAMKPRPHPTTTTCPQCFEQVDAWRTLASGEVRCLPCSHNPKRGPLHVNG